MSRSLKTLRNDELVARKRKGWTLTLAGEEEAYRCNHDLSRVADSLRRTAQSVAAVNQSMTANPISEPQVEGVPTRRLHGGTDRLTDSLDASEVDNWSDRDDAANRLPELVFRLIVATLPEPASLIDFPSGSSVRFPGWDGLLETRRGNEWAPSGVSGWEISCDQDVTSKATSDYRTRTKDPQGLDTPNTTFVFVTSRRWRDKRRWQRQRRKEGKWLDVRAYDANDLVAWLRQSDEVTRWLLGVIHRLPFDYDAVNRIEDRQVQTQSEVKAGFAEVGVELKTLIASIKTQAEQPEAEPTQDAEERRLSERIDSARELVQEGLIVTAQTQLERIQREAVDLPDELRFRLITNLAVCALGADKFDEASSLLDEAHRIQPENRTGITNAALAAHLQQNPQRAAELAQGALKLDPHDSNAAATLISALWDMGQSEQLEAFVASVGWLTQESNSASSLARVRVQQERYDEAISIYRTLIAADSDDPHARLGLSQCLITHVQVDRLPTAYSGKALADLREAELEADRAIELLKTTQFAVRRQEALVLRAGARALLGKVDEALLDVETVLGEVPAHPGAALHKGLLLLKKGLPREARKWLESIEDPEIQADSLLPLADACLESGDPTAAIALLRDSFKLDPSGREDLGRAESLLRAEAAIGAEDSVGPVLEAAIRRYPNDPALHALAAVRSSLQGDLEASETTLKKAIELAGEPHSQALQAQLGHFYASLGRFADAAEQFSKACGDDISHPEAIPMLLSLFNSRQYRRALDLARNIRETGDPPPKAAVDVEADILGYVGDVRTAVLRHGELCSRDDSTSDDRVRLAMAQFRCGERKAALETIVDIDVGELGHDPQALMRLAHMKRFLGATDYLHDAYLSRRYGLNDPATHLGYFRLFLGRGEEWEEPTVVGAGCSVQLKIDDEEQWWHILQEGEEPYGPRELSTNDDLAQRLLGRSVGEVVVLRQGLGGVSYEINAIQSKYVRAYQETLEEFATRFPDNMSLSRVKLDRDFTQIFQSIELRHQHVSNAEGLYKSQQLPFASFCSLIGSSTLDVWPEYTAQPTARLHFGMGSDKETSEAYEMMAAADVVVLDMVALLTVHRLGLADHLRARFSRVTIPQHVFDEIQEHVYQMRIDRAPSSHVGKDEEGRYTRTEITDDAWKERQAYALSVLGLAESLERIPSYPMLQADEPDRSIDVLTLAGAGAIYAGDEQSQVTPVLVSDDLVQTQVAHSLGLKALNSQAMLVELLRSDVITAEEYSSRVEQLVLMNYWFVRIRAEDILRRLETNGYQTTPGIQAMLRTLWGPDCIEDAAASIGAEIIATVAKGSLIEQRLDLLLSSVLAAIRRGRHTNQVLFKFKAEIAARLPLAPLQCARILQAVDLYMRT